MTFCYLLWNMHVNKLVSVCTTLNSAEYFKKLILKNDELLDAGDILIITSPMDQQLNIENMIHFTCTFASI